MSKRHNSKYKINRSLGLNLWGRPKSSFNKKPYRPGQHGSGTKRVTEYGKQLMAKQTLKKYYGDITEKQFKKYYLKAIKSKGDTSVMLISLLERRLDAVIYRLKFVPTIFAARQFVNHCHIKVNGSIVNIASYQVSDNDVISIKESSRDIPLVTQAMQSDEREIPTYLSLDEKNFSGKFIKSPLLEEVPYPVKMEPSTVIEYYSR